MKTLKEFSEWLEEQATRPPFDFEEFLKAETFLKALRYLVVTDLKQLGMGTGTFRAAFQLDQSRIIKIAKIQVGIQHNQKEVRNAACLGPDNAIKVFDHHPEFWWIIEERADLVDDTEFVELFFGKLGLSQNDYPYFNETDIREVISIAKSGKQDSQYPDDYVFQKQLKASRNWLRDSVWFRELIQSLRGCDAGSDDFGANNWGVRLGTNDLVLIDLGF